MTIESVPAWQREKQWREASAEAGQRSNAEAQMRGALAEALRVVAAYEANLAGHQRGAATAWELEAQTFDAWQAKLLDERAHAATVRVARWASSPAEGALGDDANTGLR